MQLRSFGVPLATLLLSRLLTGPGAAAQSLPAASATAPAPRVTGDWRSSSAVAIPHSKPPLTAPATDLGAAPSNLALNRMLLLLAPAPAQQAALAIELTSLQDSSSPNYRHWLTPQAFAQSYSNSPSDVGAVASWLESEGFTVASLPAGLGWIEFSGTVGQVEQAFGARIDAVTTPAGTRDVLSTGISVPGALAPLIAGLVSLDGVVPAPELATPQPLTTSVTDLSALTSLANAAALTPQLAALLLDLAPLTSAGVNGTGETIAIVSRSNVNSADVAAFRSAFGLPASPLSVVVDGPDPGLSGAANLNLDQAEATLAASWAGAAAPGAQVLLAPAATTSATDGVDLSLAALVDRDQANVIAVGYSVCEGALSLAHQAFYAALYQQAAAEGITVIAGSGDSGAAACTPAGSAAPVSTGLAVNALASTPWNTAVGVAGYGPGGPAAGNTALAAWSPLNPADPAYASSGGSSSLYARQAWQPDRVQLAGATSGIHNRLLPDLALPTAIDSGSNPGLAFCLSASTAAPAPASGCSLLRSGGSGVATAIFAGVAALIDQKYGAEGNIAPDLYATSQSPAASGAFTDVEQGTAQLPCVPGSPGCGAGGLIGYTAGSGYDLATGLGVPDVQKLVAHFATPAVTVGTLNFTLSISPVQSNNTYNPSASVTFTATVTDTTSTSVPTGAVAIANSTTFNNFTPVATLTPSGTYSSRATWTLEPSSFYNYTGMGSYDLGINYAVNGNPSASTGYISTITSELSPTILAITPSTNSPALGSTLTVTVNLSIAPSGPPAGSVAPTGAVTLYVNGAALTPVALSTAGGVTSAVFSYKVTTTSNSIYATYPGDSNYSGNSTLPYIVASSLATPTVVLTPSTLTPSVGGSDSLGVSIAPPAGSGTGAPEPTGSVNFLLDGVSVGTSPVIAAVPSTATFSLTSLTVGMHTIQAIYSGDTNYNSANSTIVTLAVGKGGVLVALTANYTTAQLGESVILTATVTPTTAPAAGAEQNPTGTVIFYDGTTVIGTGTLTPVPFTNSSEAMLVLTTLPGGSDSLTAIYQGDTTYSLATSNALPVSVQGFTLSASLANPPTNLNITLGGSGSESFVVTGIGGYSSPVQVICTVPTQDDMSCLSTPQVVTPTATVTFVVDTYISGGPSFARLGKPRLPGGMWPQEAGGAALAALVFFLLPFGRRARIFLREGPRRFIVLLMLLAGLLGAGIGCTSNGVAVTTTSTGTPLGVATLQVTATAYVNNAVVSQSINFTVNVQPQ